MLIVLTNSSFKFIVLEASSLALAIISFTLSNLLNAALSLFIVVLVILFTFEILDIFAFNISFFILRLLFISLIYIICNY